MLANNVKKVSSIKLREVLWKLSQKSTLRSIRHIIEISAVSNQSAMHVDTVECTAQDILTAFIMRFFGSWKKLFSFRKDKCPSPHRGPLSLLCHVPEGAKFLGKFQAHSPYP